MNIFGDELSHFYELLQSVGGKVTGSIITQQLLSNFVARDIDLFVKLPPDPHNQQRIDKQHYYTSLHRMLYKVATGQESKFQGTWASDRSTVTWKPILNATDAPFTIAEDNVLQLQLWQYGEHCQLVSYKDAQRIGNIYNYVIKGVKIQVVGIHSEKDFDMQNYIQQKFDIRSCQSNYDGVQLKLVHLDDLFHRRLIIASDFMRRARLFQPGQIESHQKRIQKYLERGFHLQSNIPYGFWYITMDKMWSIEHIIRLNTPGQYVGTEGTLLGNLTWEEFESRLVDFENGSQQMKRQRQRCS